VLIVALVVLLAERFWRLLWPADPEALDPVVSVRLAQHEAKKIKESMNDAVAKADKRYAEVKGRVQREEEQLRDFENDVKAADSFDAVDDLISKRSGRAKRPRGENSD
jgi:hypothetical protein